MGASRATVTLTVWSYDTPLGARAGAVRMRKLEDLQALEVLDAVAVTWVPGAHQPRVLRVRPRMKSRPDDVSPLAPLTQALIVSAIGDTRVTSSTSVAEQLFDTGVDAALLQRMADRLAPGLSTLIVLSGKAQLDKVRPVVQHGLMRGGVTLLHAHLEPEIVSALYALAARHQR